MNPEHAHPVAGWVCPICGTGVSPLVPEHCSRTTGQQITPVLIDSPIQRLTPLDLAAIRSRPPEGVGPPGPGSFGAGFGTPVGVPGPSVPFGGAPGMDILTGGRSQLYPQPGSYGIPGPPPPTSIPPSQQPAAFGGFRVEPPTIDTWDGKSWVTFNADDPFVEQWLRDWIQSGHLGSMFHLSTFPPPAGDNTPEIEPVWVELEGDPVDWFGPASLVISSAHMTVLSEHYAYLAKMAERAWAAMQPEVLGPDNTVWRGQVPPHAAYPGPSGAVCCSCGTPLAGKACVGAGTGAGDQSDGFFKCMACYNTRPPEPDLVINNDDAPKPPGDPDAQ